MSTEKKMIPAVGYLRKSTRGTRNGKQKQEKSLGQQKTELIKLAKGRFTITDWYVDEGISGWKRGSQRPDFQRMLDEVERLGAQAILCDHLDRFSRATVREVQRDADELCNRGVRWIVTSTHGEYDLGKKHDIGEILNFVVAVWSANEYSRQLSRRISLARRDKALEGIRTGGDVPFAMSEIPDDPQHKLKPGDPEQVKWLRWAYEQYGNRGKSLNWVCGQLNDRKVPSPTGGKWYVKTLTLLLKRRFYVGDFVYNEKPSGKFHRLDGAGEVADAESLNGDHKPFLIEHKNWCQGIVDRRLFNKVQKRLDANSTDRTLRKQQHVLTGVLFCGHCGSKLSGTRSKGEGSPIVYRCSGNRMHGNGHCGSQQVQESTLIYFILRTLGQELRSLKKVLTAPPDEITQPYKERRDRQQQQEKLRGKLVTQIAKAEKRMLFDDVDDRTFKSMNQTVKQMRDELDQLDRELAEPTDIGPTLDDASALEAWWSQYVNDSLSIPLGFDADSDQWNEYVALIGKTPQVGDEADVCVDPQKVNQLLLELGCKVTLWWERKPIPSKKRTGTPYMRHVLKRGRFQLGQQSGKVPRMLIQLDNRRARTKGNLLKPSACRGYENISMVLGTVDRVFDASQCVVF